jgi:hypothetical protein
MTKNIVFFMVILLVVYVVVTHGSAWGKVSQNVSTHLANFISTKPMANVVTTKSAWNGVL